MFPGRHGLRLLDIPQVSVRSASSPSPVWPDPLPTAAPHPPGPPPAGSPHLGRLTLHSASRPLRGVPDPFADRGRVLNATGTCGPDYGSHSNGHLEFNALGVAGLAVACRCDRRVRQFWRPSPRPSIPHRRPRHPRGSRRWRSAPPCRPPRGFCRWRTMTALAWLNCNGIGGTGRGVCGCRAVYVPLAIERVPRLSRQLQLRPPRGVS